MEKYIPIQTGLFKGIYDSCHLKSNNESQIEIGTNSIEKAAQSWVKCNSWVYSKEYFDHTLVTDVRTRSCGYFKFLKYVFLL